MSYKNRMIARNYGKEKDSPDLYVTPKWASKALMKRIKFKGKILEPACGNGNMAKVIKEYNPVIAKDLYDWGYGITGQDFLKSSKKYDNVITNPPYNRAEEFLFKGLEISKYKVALLLRVNWLASLRRYHTIFTKTPLEKVLIFCRRVPFGRPGRKKGRMIVYCWVIWNKKYKGKPIMTWIGD